MASRNSTILITGFGPFPGVDDNVSGTLAERLGEAAAKRFSRRTVVSEVLPTTWQGGPTRLVELYLETRPSIGLHFGVAQQACGFVIETLGRNHCTIAPDAAGQQPPANTLSQSAPDELPVTVPAATIVQRLRAMGLPAQLSTDAGGYLCNAVLFQALAARAMRPECSIGFIHIPANLNPTRCAGALSWDEAMAGGMEIIRTCLRLPAGKPSH